jgi:hypothetical protein
VQVVKSGFCIVDVVILVDAKIMHVDWDLHQEKRKNQSY